LILAGQSGGHSAVLDSRFTMFEMPDSTTSLQIATLLGFAQVSKDAVTDIVKRLLGPLADRAGDALANSLFPDRAKRVAEVLTESVRMITDAGMQPQAVPGRILMPILEHVSWEEDDALRKRWASLLANAGSLGPANKVLPAYVEILRQLTPDQAAILDWMYLQKTPSLTNHWPDFERKVIEQTFSLSPSDYALLVTDLARLQLVEGRRASVPSPRMTLENFDDVMETVIETLNERSHYQMINFTSLGVHFMAACTPPLAERSVSTT